MWLKINLFVFLMCKERMAFSLVSNSLGWRKNIRLLHVLGQHPELHFVLSLHDTSSLIKHIQSQTGKCLFVAFSFLLSNTIRFVYKRQILLHIRLYHYWCYNNRMLEMTLVIEELELTEISLRYFKFLKQLHTIP